MGVAFDRWLARPSTLRFLRHLVRPVQQDNRAGHDEGSRIPKKRCSRPYSAATAVHETADRDADEKSRDLRQRPLVHKATRSRRGGGPVRDALHISLRSGVALLDNGRANSAHKTLRIETNVDSDEHLGHLLVDQPEHRTNMRLWIELLQFRNRMDGPEGVIAIWRGMRRREIDLPTKGDEADVLWPAFVNACFGKLGVNAPFLDELCTYVEDLREREGRCYSMLYKVMMSRQVQMDATNARLRHDWFCKSGLLPSDAAKQIVMDVVKSRSIEAALTAFKHIYGTTDERDLYDACIGELLKVDDCQDLALTWHRFLIKHGDAPSQAMFATPGVHRLFELDQDESLPMRHAAPRRGTRHAANMNEPTTSQAAFPTLTRSTMSSLVGDVHGIKPKELSDHFVAKMFATRAFSLDLVIRGLHFFGVEQLGPLAIREMAIRAASPQTFCDKLGDLRAMEISISDAVYCRLVQKFARETHTDLFRQLLESDQHPEAYDDLHTQDALLVAYLEQSQWNKAHITLLSLSLGGAESEGRGWNRLLQQHLRDRDWRRVAQVMHSLQSQRVPLMQKTLTWLHHFLLPVRRPSKRPAQIKGDSKPRYDTLSFVTYAYTYNEELKQHVHHKLWTELLKRYGMSSRWGGLERLVLWLANRYSAQRFRTSQVAAMRGQSSHTMRSRRSLLMGSSPAHNIFVRHMQQAIVHWGFRSAAERDQLNPERARLQPNAHDQPGLHGATKYSGNFHENWAQGIALLKRLAHDFGIPIHVGEVRRAFCMRMFTLFGPGHSKLASNEEARQCNGFTLAHYIRHANDVWAGGSDHALIKVDNALLDPDADEDLETQVKLYTAFFGQIRRSSRSKKEFTDVAAWVRSQHFARTSELYRGRKLRQQTRIWQHSPFRLVRRIPSSNNQQPPL